ncbi:MAG: Zn-ribbon containing protein [Nanoarchaeota archaeon]
MPHQCVRCGIFYDDGASEILKGCKCGGKLFFYIKKEKYEQSKEVQETAQLSEKDKKQIEKDVFEIVGSDIENDAPVVLDLEAIHVLKPGKYELDLVHLFKGEPLVFKLEDGKYMIDLVESFKKFTDKAKKQK